MHPILIRAKQFRVNSVVQNVTIHFQTATYQFSDYRSIKLSDQDKQFPATTTCPYAGLRKKTLLDSVRVLVPNPHQLSPEEMKPLPLPKAPLFTTIKEMMGMYLENCLQPVTSRLSPFHRRMSGKPGCDGNKPEKPEGECDRNQPLKSGDDYSRQASAGECKKKALPVCPPCIPEPTFGLKLPKRRKKKKKKKRGRPYIELRWPIKIKGSKSKRWKKKKIIRLSNWGKKYKKRKRRTWGGRNRRRQSLFLRFLIFDLKALVAATFVYLSVEQRLWGTAEETIELYEKIKKVVLPAEGEPGYDDPPEKKLKTIMGEAWNVWSEAFYEVCYYLADLTVRFVRVLTEDDD